MIRDTILIKGDDLSKRYYPRKGWRKYGQEILSSLLVTKIWPRDTILVKGDEIWPRDTILIKGDENMAKRYYPH